MNRIVREHYPATRLPEDLREGLDPRAEVRITIEVLSQPVEKRPMSLDEIFALRRPPYRTAEEIDRTLRQERDSWDD